MFSGEDDVPRIMTPGSLVSSDDPGLKGREHLFEKVEVAAQREVDRPKGKTTVEDASAEPNTKRSITHPVKATPKTAGDK